MTICLVRTCFNISNAGHLSIFLDNIAYYPSRTISGSTRNIGTEFGINKHWKLWNVWYNSFLFIVTFGDVVQQAIPQTKCNIPSDACTVCAWGLGMWIICLFPHFLFCTLINLKHFSIHHHASPPRERSHCSLGITQRNNESSVHSSMHIWFVCFLCHHHGYIKCFIMYVVFTGFNV